VNIGLAQAAGNAHTFSRVNTSAVDYRATPIRAAKDCQALGRELSSSARIISTKLIVAADSVPEHCRIDGMIPKEIGFQVNLPLAWNGRLYMFGNGGYAGEDVEAPNERLSRDRALANGFATARTDTGHLAVKEPLATFAVDPGKVIDHGYRAVHETVQAAKSLIASFYGSGPEFSYWDGCSTGGRQGVMAAQRYPHDFNGIVAMAPTLDWTNIMIKGLWNQSALEGAGLTIPKMQTAFQAVLNKCDPLDGVRDGLIDDPRQCQIDPVRDLPRCSAADQGDSCLTDRQVEAIQRIYKGPTDSSGKPLFVSQVPGSEDVSTVSPFVLTQDGTPNRLTAFAESWMKYIAFQNPYYDPKSFNYDTDPEKIREVNEIFNPTADLALFKSAGGKMITVWGWADNALNPQMGLRFYDEVRTRLGAAETESFYRFFLVPGVAHCRGGYGPSEVDALTAVINWTEKGITPDRLPAQLSVDGKLKYQRSYCAYPRVTQYNGAGDTEDPRNYSCVQQ